MNAIFVVVVLIVILASALGIVALIGAAFYFILRANTNRSRSTVGSALQRWADDEGYELISSRQIGRGEEHPFRNRFGFRVRRHGDYGGMVFWVEIEDNAGRERAGWVYFPLRTSGGIQLGGIAVSPDWRNAEVVWEGE